MFFAVFPFKNDEISVHAVRASVRADPTLNRFAIYRRKSSTEEEIKVKTKPCPTRPRERERKRVINHLGRPSVHPCDWSAACSGSSPQKVDYNGFYLPPAVLFYFTFLWRKNHFYIIQHSPLSSVPYLPSVYLQIRYRSAAVCCSLSFFSLETNPSFGFHSPIYLPCATFYSPTWITRLCRMMMMSIFLPFQRRHCNWNLIRSNFCLQKIKQTPSANLIGGIHVRVHTCFSRKEEHFQWCA